MCSAILAAGGLGNGHLRLGPMSPHYGRDSQLTSGVRPPILGDLLLSLAEHPAAFSGNP